MFLKNSSRALDVFRAKLVLLLYHSIDQQEPASPIVRTEQSELIVSKLVDISVYRFEPGRVAKVPRPHVRKALHADNDLRSRFTMSTAFMPLKEVPGGHGAILFDGKLDEEVTSLLEEIIGRRAWHLTYT